MLPLYLARIESSLPALCGVTEFSLSAPWGREGESERLLDRWRMCACPRAPWRKLGPISLLSTPSFRSTERLTKPWVPTDHIRGLKAHGTSPAKGYQRWSGGDRQESQPSYYRDAAAAVERGGKQNRPEGREAGSWRCEVWNEATSRPESA